MARPKEFKPLAIDKTDLLKSREEKWEKNAQRMVEVAKYHANRAERAYAKAKCILEVTLNMYEDRDKRIIQKSGDPEKTTIKILEIYKNAQVTAEEIEIYAGRAADAACKAQNAFQGIPKCSDRVWQRRWVKAELKKADDSSYLAWETLNRLRQETEYIRVLSYDRSYIDEEDYGVKANDYSYVKDYDICYIKKTDVAMLETGIAGCTITGVGDVDVTMLETGIASCAITS